MTQRVVFFFNDTATTEIYTLSLHDALPISSKETGFFHHFQFVSLCNSMASWIMAEAHKRSEEHTSELQSRQYLVCRLLLEKKTTDRLVRSEEHTSQLQSRLYFVCRPLINQT